MVVLANKKMQLIDNQNNKNMKSKILSVIILLAVVTGLTKSAHAASLNVTTLNDISAINKIEIHGNVELFISDGPSDQVKVYNKYYSESALVQSKSGVLRISSYTPEKLIVWVTANDLRDVAAYDNSEVKSFGDLSKIEFNVDLHNNATAKLSLDAFSANVLVYDNAKADISGSATEFNLGKSTGSIVNKIGLTAIHYTESKTSKPAEVKTDEFVGI